MAVFLPLPGNAGLAADLARLTQGTLGQIETRAFPDGETYLRLRTDPSGEDVCIVCTLARPDEKLLPLVFAAAAARDLGAKRVRLIAPYLAYMRQDAVFQHGEALTSRTFAELVSRAFDGMVTVDPHLHRYRSLAEIYACLTTVVHAAPLIGRWIAENVERPLIVGPDGESEQWAREIAAAAAAPHLVFTKERLGDRQVRLEAPGLEGWRGYRPVLVDDIISSGTTIAGAAERLLQAGLQRPVCVAVHGLLDEAARRRLQGKTSRLVTTDSVPNPAAEIGLAELIASAL